MRDGERWPLTALKSQTHTYSTGNIVRVKPLTHKQAAELCGADGPGYCLSQNPRSRLKLWGGKVGKGASRKG